MPARQRGPYIAKKGKLMTDTVKENSRGKSKILWGFYIFAVASSAACVILRLLVLIFDFDFNLGLYKPDAVLPQVFAAFLVFVIIALLFSIKIGNDARLPDKLPPVSRLLTFISALAGFSMLATVAMQLIMKVSFEITLTGWKSTLASGLELAMQVFALPTALYFIVMAVRQNPYRASTAALGFFPVLWAAAYLMCVYFDTSTTLNNPLRILEQASLVVVMAYLLMELRCLVGKARPNLYIAFGMILMVMVASSSLPTFLLTIARRMNLSVDTMFDATKICIAVYAAVRVADMIKSAVKTPNLGGQGEGLFEPADQEKEQDEPSGEE